MEEQNSYHDMLITPVEPTPVMQSKWNNIAQSGSLMSIFSLFLLAFVTFLSTVTFVTTYSLMRFRSAMAGAEEEASMSAETLMILLVSAFLVIMCVVMAILFFHLQFTTKLKNAILTNDQVRFESAWNALRWHFRLYGILIIVCLLLFFVSGITFGDIITVLIRLVNPSELSDNLM